MLQGDSDSEADLEEPILGLKGSLIWLAIATVLISWFSELVIATIETASTSLRIPLPFLSTIVLPIVGNAAEHASAIMFAYKNRMEVTLGVAVGRAPFQKYIQKKKSIAFSVFIQIFMYNRHVIMMSIVLMRNVDCWLSKEPTVNDWQFPVVQVAPHK